MSNYFRVSIFMACCWDVLFFMQKGGKTMTRIMPFLHERRNTNNKSTREITIFIQIYSKSSILYVQWQKIILNQSPHYTEIPNPILPALVFLNKLYVTIYNPNTSLHTGYLSTAVHTFLLLILSIGENKLLRIWF